MSFPSNHGDHSPMPPRDFEIPDILADFLRSDEIALARERRQQAFERLYAQLDRLGSFSPRWPLGLYVTHLSEPSRKLTVATRPKHMFPAGALTHITINERSQAADQGSLRMTMHEYLIGMAHPLLRRRAAQTTIQPGATKWNMNHDGLFLDVRDDSLTIKPGYNYSVLTPRGPASLYATKNSLEIMATEQQQLDHITAALLYLSAGSHEDQVSLDPLLEGF